LRGRPTRVTAWQVPDATTWVAMLRICEALRDHVKGLITANLSSWERGHAD